MWRTCICKNNMTTRSLLMHSSQLNMRILLMFKLLSIWSTQSSIDSTRHLVHMSRQLWLGCINACKRLLSCIQCRTLTFPWIIAAWAHYNIIRLDKALRIARTASCRLHSASFLKSRICFYNFFLDLVKIVACFIEVWHLWL